MQVHHLSCASMCPFARPLINGTGSWTERGQLCCHCLLIESNAGLVLVDAGLCSHDLANPRGFPASVRALMQIDFDPRHSALHQVEARGYRASDVRHIVLTHLDFDHASGIVDFPHAEVHVFEDEQRAALAPRTYAERQRYVRRYWKHGPRWKAYPLSGDTWQGFDAVRALTPGETDILIVPFTGHTRGHSAVAVRHGDHWLVHCGDAYFHHAELDESPRCPPGLALFQRAVAHDDRQRLENQARLRNLKRTLGASATLFCAHDPVELSRLQAGHPAGSKGVAELAASSASSS